jgi:hypothetical protein
MDTLLAIQPAAGAGVEKGENSEEFLGRAKSQPRNLVAAFSSLL